MLIAISPTPTRGLMVVADKTAPIGRLIRTEGTTPSSAQARLAGPKMRYESPPSKLVYCNIDVKGSSFANSRRTGGHSDEKRGGGNGRRSSHSRSRSKTPQVS